MRCQLMKPGDVVMAEVARMRNKVTRSLRMRVVPRPGAVSSCLSNVRHVSPKSLHNQYRISFDAGVWESQMISFDMIAGSTQTVA